MINTIIFDIGNVLAEFCWRDMLHGFGLEDDAFEIVANATVRHPAWEEFDKGIMSTEEVIDIFAESLYGYPVYGSPALVPDEITSIGDYAFQGCDIISSAIIHNGVTEIGDYAFADCRALRTVDIGSGVNSIGKAAFKNCGKLSSAVFKETKGWWLNNGSEDVVRLLNYKISNADYAAECLKEKYSDHEWRFGNAPMAPLVRKWSPVIVLFGFVLFEAAYVLVEIMPDRKKK